MNCEANQELFSEYLDRTLVPELKDSLEEHLKRCPTCNRELQKITATVKLLSRLPELPAPPDFLVTVRQRIDRTPAWRQLLAPVAWAFSPGAGRALALASSFLFVFSVAFFFGRHYQTPPSSPMLAAKSSLPAEAWTPPTPS